MAKNQSEGSVQLRIIRGPLDSLSLYEITDYELEVLEQGSPSSTYLNFAIFFFSVGASFFTTLVAIKITSVFLFTIFVVITVVGFTASIVLFVLWRRTRSRVKDLVKKIKARVPTVPIKDATDAKVDTSGSRESSP
jgi:hypothetical protein